MDKLVGRIMNLVRDDEQMSSAQIIFATIVAEDGEKHKIEWVQIPGDPTYGFLQKHHGMNFEDAWKNAKVDARVMFMRGIHGFNLIGN